MSAPVFGQVWNVDRLFHTPVTQADGFLGQGLAVGDLDGDGRDDLYVGAPGFDFQVSVPDAGIVCRHRILSDRRAGVFAGDPETCSWSEEEDERGAAMVAADFDGDGRDEVAIGSPHADVGGALNSGLVQIVDWHPVAGWTETAISQLDVPFDDPEGGDAFGDALAAGDFNGDNRADLAVGAPMEDLPGEFDVGVVQVFYGSAAGIQTAGAQRFVPGSGGVAGTRSSGEHTGYALAAGDFDGDGYEDLAFSAPRRDIGSIELAGQVHILYGSSTGLGTAGQQLLSDASFFHGTSATNEEFGHALAAADFNGFLLVCVLSNCRDDLAIGVPGQIVGSKSSAGKVVVVYGSASGLSTSGETTLSEEDTAVGLASGARFGWRLAAGRLDPGLPDDLVVGAPFRSVHPTLFADGYVHVFFGASGGIGTGLPPQGIPEPSFPGGIAPADVDLWGDVLRIGDLDGDGYGDLVVGVPWKDWDTSENVGGVVVYFGALFADGFESGDFGGWSSVSP